MDIDNIKNKTEYRAWYFKLFAEFVRAQMLNSVVRTKLLSLFENRQSIDHNSIINQLQLDPKRAKKWFHLLQLTGFLKKEYKKSKGTYYELGELSKQLTHRDPHLWLECQQLVLSWTELASENIVEVLKGKPVHYNEAWPPKSLDDTVNLEAWMTKTAIYPLNTLKTLFNFNSVTTVLDVGGGDATMACALALQHPHLLTTVYNLPNALVLARRTIEKHNLASRVKICPGDFIQESHFPGTFDCILFTRVLWDWSIKTNEKLLKMAFESLNPNGKVVITEAFRENNPDFSLVMEYRLLFWDDFEAAVFKKSSQYAHLLEKIGFTHIQLKKDQHLSGFSVLSATKPNQ